MRKAILSVFRSIRLYKSAPVSSSDTPIYDQLEREWASKHGYWVSA